jgi:putative ABC transport system ATP-binding protein
VVVLRDLVRVREQGGVAFELRVPRFELHAGEFVALVGESGCGKSTLLDILALVLRPSSVASFLLRDHLAGRAVDIQALWGRNDEDGLARVRRDLLGYVLQSGGLLPFLDVRRNITLPRRLKTGQAGDVQELADRMGLSGMLEKKPRYLSGGQRQRAAILRALVHRPGIILADEPTAAVDRSRARSIVSDFRELAKAEGCAIAMVSHDMQLVEAFADRIYGYRLDSPAENLTRSTCIPYDAQT